MDIRHDVMLKTLTSFKIGGPAKNLVIAENDDDIEEALLMDRPFILGNGSNILFSDKGYDGTIIKLGESFSKIEVDGETITAGAAALLSRVSSIAAKEGLSGLEFACGIPASVGGAMLMNAGAYEHSISELLDDNTGFGYRKSPFMETGEVIKKAKFNLKRDNKEDIEERMREYTRRRKEKQPLSYPSAGSFFKRPTGYFAGKLIEDAGLKGCRVGDAMISDLHAGFVINMGNATCSDVTALMKHVQAVVLDKFGVELKPEVIICEE